MSEAEPIRFGPSPSPAEAQEPTPAPAWAYLLRCPDGSQLQDTGQSWHLGAWAVQTNAPNSMLAAAHRAGGTSSSMLPIKARSAAE